MQKLLDSVKKLGPTLLPALLGFRLLILIIEEIAFAGSAFGPVLGTIFDIATYILFIGGLTAALILKKEKLVIFFSVVLFCSFIYSACFRVGTSVSAWRNGAAAMTVICSVFDFLLYGIIAFMIVAHILSLIADKFENLKKYNFYLSMAVLGLSLLLVILTLIQNIINDAGWVWYVDDISYYLAYVPAMIFIYLSTFHKDVELPKVEEHKEEEKEEPKEAVQE